MITAADPSDHGTDLSDHFDRNAQSLLADQRRAHAGDHRDEVIVSQIQRIHERDGGALPVERTHVEEGR
jgi:hypothetical protein